MKKTITTAALAAIFALPLTTGLALASDKCNTPKAEWQPQEALQQKLESDGWKIKKIKVDDGCYEVYGTDQAGKRIETYFDPKTFAVVQSKQES